MAIHKLTLPLPPVHRQEMRRRAAAAAAHRLFQLLYPRLTLYL